MPFDITQEQAVEAGKVCGALIFGYLWQLQQVSAGPDTIPFSKKSTATGKKFLTAREAWLELGVEKSKFFKMKREDRDNFPKPVITAAGKKYKADEIEKYKRLLKPKKAN